MRWLREHVAELHAYGGLGLAAVGVGLHYLPAGFVVGGVGLFYLAFRVRRERPASVKERPRAVA